jgi:plasmid segregation protein ParM
MNIGLDIGYRAVKAVSDGRRVIFPSVVGTPEVARFSLSGDNGIILSHPVTVQVGDGAITQSRFSNRREDRSWIHSDEWYSLFLSAITELTTATRVDLHIVTGLPVAFFADRDAVQGNLIGPHRVQREGRHAQSFNVVSCHVIPQPFGALLAETLGDVGRIVDQRYANGRVGVIDAGGKTTNLLSVNRLAEIGRETASVNVGGWDAVRSIRDWLSAECPGLEDMRDHQIAQAIIDRQIRYYGEPVDLSDVVAATLAPLAEQIVAEASRLWNGGATLDAILVSGGGALLLGDRISGHFRHAVQCDDPVFANALGFWRFAQRLVNRS